MTSYEIHHSHRDVSGGWLRPAVFGAMDGLVSNFALMAGVAGGSTGSTPVVLAGLAGLAAGAFSMAAGEYTSVATQTELVHAEIELERQELLTNAVAEERELAEMYVARGLDPTLAAQVAEALSTNADVALEVHVREELGVDPGGLASPWTAAGSSFLAFVTGALVPLIPYLFGATSLWPSAVLSLLGLFGAGVLASRVTSRSWWFGGVRQALIGAAAAAVTFALGSLVGG